MTILWCGGEDIDFPNGTYYALISDQYCVYNDCTFSRYSIRGSSLYISSQFKNGSVNSAWLHGRISIADVSYYTLRLGLTNDQGKGIYMAAYSSTLYIFSYNGTTWTSLASQGSTLPIGQGTWDIHIENYGENATITCYANGIQKLQYSGNISISGVSGFSNMSYTGENYYNGRGDVSEIIVADEDTRLFRLKTLAPNAAGDTNDWTGAYTDIDETSYSDVDKIYTGQSGNLFTSNLTGMPSGEWSVKAVKMVSRAVDGTGSLGVKLGVKTNGTVNVGDVENCSGYWGSHERLMTVNPVTGVAWTPAEIEALQLAIESGTV